MKWNWILQLVAPALIFWSGVNSENAFERGDTVAGIRLLSAAIMVGVMLALYNVARLMTLEETVAVMRKKWYRAMVTSLDLAMEVEANAAGSQMAPVAQPVNPPHVKMPNAGYVYLLKEVNGEHHKIGRARDPKDRLRTFSVKLPYQVEFTCLIQTDDMFRLERQLHMQFASKRVNGEWFKLSDEDVDSIVALAKVENAP